jgi:hypothetical protein
MSSPEDALMHECLLHPGQARQGYVAFSTRRGVLSH